MGTKILSSVFTALLLFQLTACGNTSPSTINSAANSTPLPILGNIHLPLHSNTGPPNNPVSFDMAGLHVQTEVGFQCSYELRFSVVGGNIVLDGNSLTYT